MSTSPRSVEETSSPVDLSGLQRATDNACAVIDQLREERDALLAVCREMRAWLRPEVVKEPDRTFFWKLVYVIDRVEIGKS